MSIILNTQQEKAVKHKSGPLLIIAGAGTGKTAVITQRILHIVNSGWAKPSEILALTFTEKAANEMLERVDMEMPLGYEEMWISTFHAFCDKILRQEGQYIGLDTNYTIMNSAQSYMLFRQHIFDFPLETLRPLGNPTSFIGDILKHFSRLQDEDVTPEDYIAYAEKLVATNAPEKESKQNAMELAATYKAYIELKIKNSRLDFSDLIVMTLKLFREKPGVLEKYAKKFKYILVDEFQDTNYTQNCIITTILSKKKPSEQNITVVGDDDQAIYKFRGAAISNILNFKKDFKNVTSVVLNENYRSRQEILDAAYALISNNNPNRLEITEGVDKKLIAAAEFADGTQPVTLFCTVTSAQEADRIAKEILALNQDVPEASVDNPAYDVRGQAALFSSAHKKKYNFSDIAVLVRANDQSEEFIQAFRYHQIPYKFGGPKGLYNRQEVLFLISFVRVIVDYSDDVSMFNILRMPNWKLNAREIVELVKYAKSRKMSIFETLEDLWHIKAGQSNIDLDDYKPTNLVQKLFCQESILSISNMLMCFDKAYSMIKEGKSTGEILLDFAKNSGYLSYLVADESAAGVFKVQNVSKYFNSIKEYEGETNGENIYAYRDYLDYSLEIGESPSVDTDYLAEYDAVNIMTVHGAKGLEFPVVFVVNLVSSKFPVNNRQDRLPIPDALIREIQLENDEDVIHLQEERRLFYVAATRAKEKLYLTAAQYYGAGKMKRKTSIFLDEILERKVTDTDLIDYGDTDPLSIPVQSDYADYDNLRIGFVNKFSYTQLSSYEKCPKQYRYKYVLMLPTGTSGAQSFGRTVHNTLKDFYCLVREAKSGLGFSNMPEEKDMIRLYETNWISDGYESRKHEEMRKKGGYEIFHRYFTEIFSSDDLPVLIEHRFNYSIDDIFITGSIDRVDLLDTYTNNRKDVTIIDYKTGKVPKDLKDKNDIMQLALYALALEKTGEYNVNKASLIFVEHGVRLDADLSEKNKQELISKVKDIAQCVRSMKFGANPGMMCRYCDFRTICEDAKL